MTFNTEEENARGRVESTESLQEQSSTGYQPQLSMPLAKAPNAFSHYHCKKRNWLKTVNNFFRALPTAQTELVMLSELNRSNNIWTEKSALAQQVAPLAAESGRSVACSFTPLAEVSLCKLLNSTIALYGHRCANGRLLEKCHIVGNCMNVWLLA